METNLTKRRWIILIASCVINLCIGSLYAWSIFSNPMAAYLSETTGTEIKSLAYIFTIANAVGPITMISGGALNKKLGVRTVIILGGILFGLGMILSGFVKSPGLLAVTYGLGVGLGCGCIYGCTVSNSIKFFPDKKGLIGGLAAASYGISSVIIPIIANVIISNFSVTTAFKLLGSVMLVLILISSCFIVSCPDGFTPEGYVATTTSNNKATVDKNYKEMLKDPIFYVMLVMMLCGAFSGMMIISQASPMSQNLVGMSAAAAAVIVSILALANTLGRIVSGYMADKLGFPNALIIAFVVTILGLSMLLMSKEGSETIFRIGICFVGFGFGSLMGTYPGFTSAQFGTKHNGVNFGIMFIGFALAGYLGPIIMSSLYASTNTYRMAFIIAVCLSILGIILNFIYRKMNSKK